MNIVRKDHSMTSKQTEYIVSGDDGGKWSASFNSLEKAQWFVDLAKADRPWHVVGVDKMPDTGRTVEITVGHPDGRRVREEGHWDEIQQTWMRLSIWPVCGETEPNCGVLAWKEKDNEPWQGEVDKPYQGKAK